MKILGHWQGGTAPTNSPRLDTELLTCLPFSDVCIWLGPDPTHPFSFPQIIPCVFGVRRKMEGVGAALTLFPLRLLLDTQHCFHYLCRMVYSSLIDASPSRKFSEGYSFMSKNNTPRYFAKYSPFCKSQSLLFLINIKLMLPDES